MAIQIQSSGINKCLGPVYFWVVEYSRGNLGLSEQWSSFFPLASINENMDPFEQVRISALFGTSVVFD